MVKFIVIEKNKILKFIFLILLSLFLLFILFLFFYEEKVLPSFMSSTIHTQSDNDFDGDGTIDSIIIDKKNSHYIIKVKTSKNEYILKTNSVGDSLIDLYDSVSPRIESLDLSRDGLPELILSGFKDKKPITYIFQWNNGQFDEIFSTTKNIIGIIDSHNSRTPKIMYTFSEKGDESTQAFIFNGLETKDITFSQNQIPALGVIQKFIDLIQLDYEIDETPGIFTQYINSNELGILWNLSKDTYRYSFQNSYFFDVNWDENTLPSSILWTLSFEKVNSLDSTKPKEELIFIVKTDINQFGEYKISSIKKQN